MNTTESQIARAETLAAFSGSNTFEEIKAVAYDAATSRLVVDIGLVKPWGFGSATCCGSTEFIRFFLHLDGGWRDCGLVACHVEDDALRGRPGSQRIHLPIDLQVGDQPRLNLRAILSWQMIPPTRQAEWQPVWGEVKDFSLPLASQLPS